jgi:hypothetical protein
MVNTQRMSIYEGRLNHGSKQSIPYFEGENNPREAYIGTVQHLLASKSEKSEWKRTKPCSFDLLPRYATQCRIAAKRCFTASCYLMALNRPGSVEVGQDMLHKRCLQRGKITVS